MASFSEIIAKLAEESKALTPSDKQEIVLQARMLENAAQIVGSVVIPGTSNLKMENVKIGSASIDNAQFNNKLVSIDSEGINVLNNDGFAGLNFWDGNWYSSWISDWTDQVGAVRTSLDLNVEGESGVKKNQIRNLIYGEAGWFSTGFTYDYYYNDANSAKRAYLWFNGSSTDGAMQTVEAGGTPKIELHAEGSNSHFTSIHMDATSRTPWTSTGDVHIYLKGSYLVFQYTDAGTVRYKYLDLAGTGVTWVHTTSAP